MSRASPRSTTCHTEMRCDPKNKCIINFMIIFFEVSKPLIYSNPVALVSTRFISWKKNSIDLHRIPVNIQTINAIFRTIIEDRICVIYASVVDIMYQRGLDGALGIGWRGLSFQSVKTDLSSHST